MRIICRGDRGNSHEGGDRHIDCQLLLSAASRYKAIDRPVESKCIEHQRKTDRNHCWPTQ